MIIKSEELDKIPDLHYKAISYVFEQNMVPTDGLWMEFGVFVGASLRRLAKWNPNHIIYGLDSFLGLPEDWVGRTDQNFTKGAFTLDGWMPEVPSNVTLVKGWYKDSLPAFIKQHTDHISFMHVDSDIYSSAKDIFTILGPRISNGCIIVFDELVEYPGFEAHEWKAWWEFVDDNNITFEWIGGNKSRQTKELPSEGIIFEFDRPEAKYISPPWENVAVRIINNPSFTG